MLSGGSIAHRTFADLPGLLRRGDLLVLNETRVIPARLLGVRDDGGRAELLLLHPANGLRYDPEARMWVALTRPARRLREGTRIAFGELGEAVVTAILAEGMREVELAAQRGPRRVSRAGGGDAAAAVHSHRPVNRGASLSDRLRASARQRGRTDGFAALHTRSAARLWSMRGSRSRASRSTSVWVRFGR